MKTEMLESDVKNIGVRYSIYDIEYSNSRGLVYCRWSTWKRHKLEDCEIVSCVVELCLSSMNPFRNHTPSLLR